MGLNTKAVAESLMDRIRKDVEEMFKPLWIGADGTEYRSWEDLPNNELLKARLAGVYEIY